MSSESTAAACSIIYLGLDVHKESITIAVLPSAAKGPTRIERLANELLRLKRWLERVARDGEIRACYEASGAGHVLQRALREWSYACDVIAPSLIPKRPGVQRKHDTRDARELARLYRAGELTPVRIPTEAEERVRDVVRCREIFQHEILKSRHYILKFLARRGSRVSGRHELVYAPPPLTLAPMVQRLQCFRGIAFTGRDGVGDGDCGLASIPASDAARGVSGPRVAGRLEWRPRTQRVDHQSRE